MIQPYVVTDERGTMGMQVGETVWITGTGIERLHEYPMRLATCVKLSSDRSGGPRNTESSAGSTQNVSTSNPTSLVLFFGFESGARSISVGRSLVHAERPSGGIGRGGPSSVAA